MTSNYFECCSRVNPSDSVPEALSNVIIHNKKQDEEIAKRTKDADLAAVAKSGSYNDLGDKPVALPNPKPITINGQRYDGSEAVTVTVSSEGGGTPVEIDNTLTQSGKAADAKAVGDRLNELNQANAAQNTEIAKKANADDLAAVAKSGSYNDLSNKPTIPPVPSALPNPNALTFTGAVNETYDGSAAKSVSIPAVPESLKNPNKLTFTGAVTAEYDGSIPVSVEIPSVGGGTDFTPFIEDAAADVKQVADGPYTNLQISFSKNASEVLIVIGGDMEMAYTYLALATMFPNGKTSGCGEYRGNINNKYAWIRVTRDMWHKWGSMYLSWATYGSPGGWSSCSVAHNNNTVATQDQPVLAGVRIGPFKTIPSTIAVYIKEG